MTSSIIDRTQNKTRMNADISTETLFDATSADQRFKMTISSENADVLLAELSDLSSDKGAYAVREAFSNAYDATKASDDPTSPIEMRLERVIAGCIPDGVIARILLNAYDKSKSDIYGICTVTDHGIGMTRSDVERYFCQYGSSKKDGRETVGSKGLGAKAPLAVSDWFDVVTCRDGKRTHVKVTREDDGNFGEVISCEDCPSDEHGTTVTIPVNDSSVWYQMECCAKSLYDYCYDARVVLNDRDTAVDGNAIGNEYFHVGDIKVGVDERGDDVVLPFFARRDISYRGGKRNFGCVSAFEKLGSDAVNLALNIGGAIYPFYMNSYNRQMRFNYRSVPYTYIVGCLPGMLNFTLSRDEIKSDRYSESLRSAIVEAFNAYDRTDVARRMFGEMGVTQTLRWLDTKIIELVRDEDTLRLCRQGKLLCDIRMTDDMFEFDGIDYSDLVIDGISHEKMDQNGRIAPSIAVIERDSSNKYASLSKSKGKWGGYSRNAVRSTVMKCAERVLAGRDALSGDILYDDTVSLGDDEALVTLAVKSSDRDVAVIVSDCGDRFKRCFNSIPTFIAASGKSSCVIGFKDGGVSPSDRALAIAKESGVSIITADDYIKKVVEWEATHRASRTRKPSGKTARIETRSCNVISLSNVGRNGAGSLVDCVRDGRLSVAGLALAGGQYDFICDYSSYRTVDIEGMDVPRTLFFVGRLDSSAEKSDARYTDLMTAALMAWVAAVDCGKLDVDACSSIVMLDSLTASDANRIKELGGRFLADVRTSGRHLDSVIDGIDGFTIAAGEKREGRRRGTLNVVLGAGCKNAALVKNLFELNVNRAIYSTSSSATIIADVRRLFFDGRFNCDIDRFADAIAAISGEAHLPKYSGWRSKYATGHVGIACRTRNFVSFDASLDDTDDALIGRICVKTMEHLNDLGMIEVISNVADNESGIDHDMSVSELATYRMIIGCALVSAVSFAINECETEGTDCSGVRARMMPHKGDVSAAFDMVKERSYMLDVA